MSTTVFVMYIYADKLCVSKKPFKISDKPTLLLTNCNHQNALYPDTENTVQ